MNTILQYSKFASDGLTNGQQVNSEIFNKGETINSGKSRELTQT